MDHPILTARKVTQFKPVLCFTNKDVISIQITGRDHSDTFSCRTFIDFSPTGRIIKVDTACPLTGIRMKANIKEIGPELRSFFKHCLNEVMNSEEFKRHQKKQEQVVA